MAMRRKKYSPEFKRTIVQEFEAGKTSGQLAREYEDSFEFDFVTPGDLDPSEKDVFQMADQIFDLNGGRSKKITEIRISETMKKELGSFRDALGVW